MLAGFTEGRQVTNPPTPHAGGTVDGHSCSGSGSGSGRAAAVD